MYSTDQQASYHSDATHLIYRSCRLTSSIPASACAFGVRPDIIPLIFRSSLTSDWNLFTKVAVIWCCALRLSPVVLRLEAVYAPLRLPPATTVGLTTRLRPLPASQLALG